ncbi:MAG: SDR family NAD(P)-dependent oxidoreductase [Pseudomonadota bacterium]
MAKTILITGSTDGIGLVTAEMLAAAGHTVLLHGRNPVKLADAEAKVSAAATGASAASVETYLADLSDMAEVDALADRVAAAHDGLDALINNAGIFKTAHPMTAAGLDVRFAVNTLAPYRLTKRLLPLIGPKGRVVNLSSAAQSPVDLEALFGRTRLADMPAYAQSKLAITMWTAAMARTLPEGPVVVSVNPGSLLGSKMVKEGFGVEGGDIRIGASILVRAALGAAFADASGRYFDNDRGSFGPPHADALDAGKCDALVQAVEACLDEVAGRA